MGFNYGLEKRKFTEEWKKLYSEYTVISRPSSQSTSMSWSMAISSRVSSLFSFKFSRSSGLKNRASLLVRCPKRGYPVLHCQCRSGFLLFLCGNKFKCGTNDQIIPCVHICLVELLLQVGNAGDLIDETLNLSHIDFWCHSL